MSNLEALLKLNKDEPLQAQLTGFSAPKTDEDCVDCD